MDTFIRHSQADKADIDEVRKQLKLTVHDIALALATRSGDLVTLKQIATDLRSEASILTAMAAGKTRRNC